MFTLRRSIGFTSVVLLSLALPIGVAIWSLDSFLASGVEPFSYATLKNGEIWFEEYHSSGGLISASFGHTEVKCINLATGVARSTGLRNGNDSLTPIWVGDILYLISSSAVYQCVDMGTDKPIAMKYVVALPHSASQSMITRTSFLYDGELTTVIDNKEGECQLIHLRDGSWQSGRRIRLPPQNVVWYDDSKTGRKMLLPTRLRDASLLEKSIRDATEGETEVQSAAPVVAAAFISTIQGMGGAVPLPMAAMPGGGSMWALQVEQRGKHLHAFYIANNAFSAYRDGLEFEDGETEAASALSPENSMQNPNGWEPIPSGLDGDSFQQMICDHDGALFASYSGTLMRRSSTGAWTKLHDVTISAFNPTLRTIADTSNATVYFVGDSGKLFRIEGDSIQPTTFKVADSERDYFDRWQRLLLGFIGAWLLHYCVVALGVVMLTRSKASANYEFGIQRAVLASPIRRGLAISIDLVILAAILSASIYGHSRFLGLNHVPTDQGVVLNTLLSLENSFVIYDLWDSFWQIASTLEEFAAQTMYGENDEFRLTLITLLAMVSIDTGLVLWLLKVYDEGRYGMTPGKWLFGIRTMRTTLRHCGLSRTIVRDVLLAVDLVGFVTPLPAAASLVFSSIRQRWGDRVADTIVVDAKSTAEASNCRMTSEK